ncbi:MAG: peptidase, partial [bacterium]|nr:peptidase [bacterium]
DNQHVSTYVPIYAGVQEIHDLYKIYDPDKFEEGSARWAIDFVDNLLYLKWQEAIKDLRRVRDPMEKSFFDEMSAVEAEALMLFRLDPDRAKKYLTELTQERMVKIVDMYKDLRNTLIVKYTNNKQGM